MVFLPKKKKFIHTPKKFRDGVNPNVKTFRIPRQDALTRKELDVWIQSSKVATSTEAYESAKANYIDMIDRMKWYEQQYFWWILRTTILAGLHTRPEDAEGGSSDQLPDPDVVDPDRNSRDYVHLRMDSKGNVHPAEEKESVQADEPTPQIEKEPIFKKSYDIKGRKN